MGPLAGRFLGSGGVWGGVDVADFLTHSFLLAPALLDPV